MNLFLHLNIHNSYLMLNLQEHCGYQCQHRRCNTLCGEPCTVAPCSAPCDKILPCGHSCVGFCSDPCPPLCRSCDEEQLTTIMFGFEDDDDAR